MDDPVLHHEGPWTEEAFRDLSATACPARVQLVDGTLIVGPAGTPERGEATHRVRTAVEAALPPGLRVIGPTLLRLGLDCVLVPDLVVTRVLTDPGPAENATPTEDATPDDERGEHPEPESEDDSHDEARAPKHDQERDEDPAPRPSPEILDAADALMVIELVGPEHGAVDRSFKPQLYARSRIPYSLLLDHDGSFAVAHMLIAGRYHEYGQADEVLRVQEPFPLEIDLRAATRDPEQVRAGAGQ